jgi:RNA polymerase sigma factor (TIGR02999 family)
LAHRRLGSERTGHTLSTTALVHEAYLRLLDERSLDLHDRAEFFAHASRAMRRILVDYARRHRALRRGGSALVFSLETFAFGDGQGSAAPQPSVVDRAEEVVELDEALELFARVDARAARVVECRFFGGLTEAETAAVVGATERTVARDWVKAKAWLLRAMSERRRDA